MKRVFWIGLIVFALDQLTKYWVVQVLDLKTRGVIAVIDPYLVFQMAWNRGINFGLFASHEDAARWILIVAAFGLSGFVIWYVRSQLALGVRRPRALSLAGGMMLGGAMGNVVDRVIYGAVADFINNACCGFTNPFSYNVADIGIFAGAAGLVLFADAQKPA